MLSKAAEDGRLEMYVLVFQKVEHEMLEALSSGPISSVRFRDPAVVEKGDNIDQVVEVSLGNLHRSSNLESLGNVHRFSSYQFRLLDNDGKEVIEEIIQASTEVGGVDLTSKLSQEKDEQRRVARSDEASVDSRLH